MEHIISKIYDLLKETNNLIEFEEQVHLLMYDTFADLVGEVFSQLDKVVKQEKQTEHWTVERCDEKSLQFTFGHVRSEEHTSELQSRGHLVCRLLLEKKKNRKKERPYWK